MAELRGASKVFRMGSQEIVALDKTNLALRAGELLLILGPSGSGKTTLISLLGCVLYPTEGCVCIDGADTASRSERQLAELRRKKIGFVFQNFNLVAPLTSEENILVPLILNRWPMGAARKKVRQAMDMLGISQRRNSLPKQLSGGEQQRVAIARALVTDPPIILCDEPTASLDVRSIEVILKELRGLADAGKAVAVVSHDQRLKPYADRVIELRDGRVLEVGKDVKTT